MTRRGPAHAGLAAALGVALLVPGMILAGEPDVSPAAPSPLGSGVPMSPSRPAAVARLGWEVVSRRPHDVTAWTQGLFFDGDGRLFEGTGLTGESQVRELDPQTGAVLRSIPTPRGAYGEGIALVGDRLLVQITWRDGLAFSYDKDTFAQLGTFSYAGEGWGLCWDGERLVMSDGLSELTFRDPVTFAEEGRVAVTLEGQPVERLNELECADGRVWANVWETDQIVRIDPATGEVDGVLDASRLLEPHPARSDPGAVLNGIARVPGGDTWLLTGKRWPQLIEVRINER